MFSVFFFVFSGFLNISEPFTAEAAERLQFYVKEDRFGARMVREWASNVFYVEGVIAAVSRRFTPRTPQLPKPATAATDQSR